MMKRVVLIEDLDPMLKGKTVTEAAQWFQNLSVTYPGAVIDFTENQSKVQIVVFKPAELLRGFRG